MSEADKIARTKSPVTVDSLTADLGKIGVRHGDILIVHTSLASLGWVCGGAVAVIQALIEAVGSAGTLVMPAHSAQITNPANWAMPPVPKEWIEPIKANMPPFDARTTPTRNMGAVAELFRTWPGAARSNHPSASFAALGPLAEEITREHALDDPLGEHSPLGALYRLEAKVLLIGVDFNRCTALHLAEQRRWPDRLRIMEGAPLIVTDTRRWIDFEIAQVMDDDEFLAVGASAMEAGLVTKSPLGEADARLTRMREIVDHAVTMWG
ncbi:aminoglycoside N(3)-acetyltransferase [Rhizobium lusitanum]|uniref:Aminoglycoside N(3)-acetyltransferase n=1 Tax=Rhizobium lusitanum TaxID=293958 RepID=A0A7X0IRZ4_9HYPH|nr:AAC(3) family N-acetyltransferase [Rhizobium lusitanum]MBB6486060.1 aminoglycoside 3-N-acetyltransferase [Rhizobium lusitanum]